MEAPPPAPPPLSATASAATVVVTPTYPNSVSSSPRSRLTDSFDADAPPTAPPQKLRLMCSYGGHIIPRPHDKTLCYIGGDTRIIVIDRQTSLADLHHRLSKTLLHNQEFSLKYQLPNEDLDSLISVTTDEDLENMVEEYDRLNNATRGLKPGRLRLFLFPKSSSIEQILVESASTKSEDWFLNALNGGKTTTSDRGHSESSSVNCLLGLDDDLLVKSGISKDFEAQLEGKKNSVDGSGNNNNNNNNNNNVINPDGHSVPDSPMLETSSSFGSTSSSPSMVNLPPIRVRLEEIPKLGVVGIDEHFQQMTVGVGDDANLMRKKTEEVEGLVAEVPGALVSGMPVFGGGEYVNRVQAPLQQQHFTHFQMKQGGAIDLASPDSVSSEGSMPNPLSRQRQAIYQEPFIQFPSRNSSVNINPDKNNSTGQMQPQVSESGYVLSSQFDQNHPQLHQQQQFVHTGMQYCPAGAVPIASYYPMYPTQQQHHPHQPLLEQRYPVYFMPARQAQAYNLPVQPPNYNELTPDAASSRQQMPPSTAAAPLASYNTVGNTSSHLEIAAGVYRTTASSAPVRVPINQNQAQYVGFTQVYHPQQPVAPSSALNSIYEFTDPTHAQMYCTQPLPVQLAAQYQTLMPASAAVLPEATAQLPTENLKPQVQTSQP